MTDELQVPRTGRFHKVEYLSYLYGEKKKAIGDMFVNSMHHQGLLTKTKKPMLDGNFAVLAKTKVGVPKDEKGWIVEAFRIKNDKANILAVQWHPEELMDYRLIQSFFGVEVQKSAPVVDTEVKLLEMEINDKRNK